jgi:ATP-dependent helicase/nuclease subunit A
MAYQPNEQQLMAINEFDSDLLVSAGAGTGKTTVLTSKYLKLLAEGRAEVNEIVAITFTKKAAAEMSARIQKAIREHCEQAVDPEEARIWREHLSKIENARIATFHSLCLSLIREYPVEAGIPPATGVLAEGDENLLLQQAIATTLTAAFDSTEGAAGSLPRLLLESGWEALEEELAGLYRKIRESGLDFTTITQLSRVNLQAALDGNPVEAGSLIAEVTELLEYAAHQKLTDRALELIGGLRGEWPEICRTLTETTDLERQNAVLIAIKKALPKNLPNCVKDRVTAVHELVENFRTKLLDREASGRIDLLRELLEGIDRNFTEAKLVAGVLDFTDQQLLARDLLRRHPQLTAKIRQGIRYIMVDEFQDTNSLQLELINLLTGDDYSGGRLMAVGDIKQSIYRFRGAEAGVILSLAKQMQAGRGRVVPLTRNYRSSQLVIRFVNQLSQRLFTGEAFSYEPLESAQPDSGARLEMLYCGPETDLKGQARMVAGKIAAMIRESRDTERPIRYKDIVLLFRASTAMPLFQQALQELGIPYYAASGGHFYRRQEVIDQINLLRLIRQRYDGVALSGLLTSPYVGLTEEQLVLIGQGRSLVEQFYETREFSAAIAAAARQRLGRFREVILFLQANREDLDIPSIIRLALDRLDYRELLWTLPHAGQRLANLEKLLLKADEFSAKGYHDLAAFLAYIKELETSNIKEGEAQTQAESSDVVRLMTIHRSKGLEFPVVILPDLDRRFTSGNAERFSFRKEVGIGLKIVLENTEVGATTLWRRIKELERREETAELKRVLYVALTRAKQRLVLAGSGASASKGDTLETATDWMKWLELLLPPADRETTQIDFDGVPVRIIRDLPEAAQPEKEQILLDLYAPQLHVEFPPNQSHAEVAAVISQAPPVINLKVSGVVTYKECPRRFYLKYLLNLPEITVSASPHTFNEPSGPTDALGAKIGVFLHQAARLKPEAAWPEQIWRQTFGDPEDAAAAKLLPDVRLMWENLQRSEFSRTTGETWDEVPFLLKLGANLRVEGRFDRLLQHAHGELVLVDYKTHRAPRAKVMEIAPQYFWQLRLYALAVAALWGRKPDRAVVYFLYSETPITVSIDDSSLADTVAEVKEIGRLLAGQRLMSEFPKRNIACEHCVYWWFCKTAPR